MQDIERKDKQYVWHPFTQMQDWVREPQMTIAAAQGVKLIDTDGKEYYDGVSSLWVNMHGHRQPTIDQSIIDQLGKVAHTTMLGLNNIPATELAEQLVAIVPPGLTKVFYSDDGSTAVEIAIKMAFQYWQLSGRPQKTKFVTLAQAYHGDTIGTVSVGGIDLFHRIFKPLLFETIHVPSPSCYHCGLNGQAACGNACLAELERVLASQHDEIAAMVVEPLVQAAAGMLMQPAGYLAKVREFTKKYDVLLIVDEVATGFGRTGKMFACEHEHITPDLMTLSKGITGGYLPLAATLTTEAIYNAFLGNYAEHKTFYHGHSYTGNPLACAAALGNLQVFREENVIANLPPKMAVISNYLQKIAALSSVGDARQCGMIVGIELMQDKTRKLPFTPEQCMGAKVCAQARQMGLIIRPIGDVVIFMPPLASTCEEIAAMLAIIYEAILAVQNDDKISASPIAL